MANERSWDSIGPVAFIADGGTDGVVTIASVAGMRVKQEIVISGIALPTLNKLEIKRVLSPTKIIVGPIKTTGEFLSRANVSAYTTAALSTIKVIEQKKSKPPSADILSFVYEPEGAVALRTMGVDEIGRPWSVDNPMPTTATISGDLTIGTNGYDLNNPDSMNATGSEDGTETGIKHSLRVDNELDLRVGISDGANKATVSADGKLSVSDADVQTLLANVITQLQSGSLSIGTEDGTETGVQHVFVNNLKSMILASQDRVRDVTYLDPTSKKNRRVEKFEFTSATFPGITLVRSFNYNLIGSDYVFVNDNWTLI